MRLDGKQVEGGAPEHVCPVCCRNLVEEMCEHVFMVTFEIHYESEPRKPFGSAKGRTLADFLGWPRAEEETQHYHVNADLGDDSNDGRTPETAFKTIDAEPLQKITKTTVVHMVGTFGPEVYAKANELASTQGRNVVFDGGGNEE